MRGDMGGLVLPFTGGRAGQVGFTRPELTRILDLYGRMVTAGIWRDYAMDMGQEVAVFAAFRRSAERPEVRIEKRPALRNRQGMWALINEQAAQGKLSRTYVESMHQWVRGQLETSLSSLTRPNSEYGIAMKALLVEPADAQPQALRAHADKLKQIEDGLESA